MGALPLLNYIAAQDLFARGRQNNVYTRIGVKPVINARGPWTYISGTLELPEVKAAKQQASEYFVNIWKLHRAVGKRMAELSGAEAGLVTSGAAGAMAAATAACNRRHRSGEDLAASGHRRFEKRSPDVGRPEPF
jgi:seryl-tRNA(Sec) selenium transferase